MTKKNEKKINQIEDLTPNPFIKWAGGKRQVLPVIKRNLPESFERYLEPFLGGGAVFFNLDFQSAEINDINPELMNAYEVIKTKVNTLISKLKEHKDSHCQEYFYEVRKQKTSNLSKVERAARFIYLNKTCFNGLYRENSRGEFNVPFGRYSNPNIVDEANLRRISEFLKKKNVTIECMPYDQFILKYAQEGDFIYLDPPYFPIKKNSFTKYHKGDFLEDEQKRLAELFKELDKKGCKILLSNSNTNFIKELYKDFNIIEVEASRSVSSDGSKRKKQKIEVLIKNY